MATRFLNEKSQYFFYENESGDRKRYVLIFGDEVNTLTAPAPSGGSFKSVEYRGRVGEWKEPDLATERSLEMYFLDVGQGDAAFVVTPNDTKILVDGGLHDRALGFLIWKYRLDQAANEVTIDHLFLSHADGDHVEGLIPLLNHPKISVTNIYHNGIGVFDSGFDETIGDLSADEERLVTLHDSLDDLDGLDLANDARDTFKDWIDAVRASGATYQMLSSDDGVVDIGDPEIDMEILGPILEEDGESLPWFGDKSHTINGNSLIFRIDYRFVRTLFSGDLNIEGSEHFLSFAGNALKANAHIFKAPHHGSHEFSQELLNNVKPMITAVSSGDSPDHGHPRAAFLGGLGLAGRGAVPLVFSTAIAATFVDTGDDEADPEPNEPTTLGDLDFSNSNANKVARRRFKKVLPGIINVRTNGEEMYAFRRVQQGYQWESYGPIEPIEE